MLDDTREHLIEGINGAEKQLFTGIDDVEEQPLGVVL